MIRSSHLPNIAGTPRCAALRPVRTWACRNGVGLTSHRSARGSQVVAAPGNFTGRRAWCTLNRFFEGVPCGRNSSRGEVRYDFATTVAGLTPRRRSGCAFELPCPRRRPAVALLLLCRDGKRSRFIDAPSLQRPSLRLRIGRTVLEVVLLFQSGREARLGSPQRRHAAGIRYGRTGIASDLQSIAGSQELLLGGARRREVVLFQEGDRDVDGGLARQGTSLDFVSCRRSLSRRRGRRMAQCSCRFARQSFQLRGELCRASSSVSTSGRIDSDFGISIDGGSAASNRLGNVLSRFRHFLVPHILDCGSFLGFRCSSHCAFSGVCCALMHRNLPRVGRVFHSDFKRFKGFEVCNISY